MNKLLFLDDLEICQEACRIDDERLLRIWNMMRERGFNPHAWHSKKNRITNQQWYDAVESELVRRLLI